MAWLDTLLQRFVRVDGAAPPRDRSTLDLRGGGGIELSVADDPVLNATRVTVGLLAGGTPGQFIGIDGITGLPGWVTVSPGDATSIRTIPVDASVAAAGAGEDTYVLTYSHGTGFVLAAGGSGGGYATIQNNGTPVTTRTILNLPTGCGLVAADDTISKTTLTVAGLTTTHLSASANIAASQLAAGSAGTVLVGGSPNSFSAAPSVTSLTASSFVAAGGGTLADAGAVRMAATARIANRNNGNTANNTTGWTSDVWDVSAGATKLLSVGASVVAIETAPLLGFAAAVAAPTITQSAVVDAAGQHLTVRAQGNNSAASAAGNLVLGGGVNAGAGAHGVTRVMSGATLTAEFGAGYLSLGTAPGSGPTATAATGTLRGPRDFTFNVRNNGDSADIELFAYSSGANALTVASNSVLTLGGHTSVALRVNSSSRVIVSSTDVSVFVPAMRYASTVAAPAFGQSTTAAATVTGQPFEIHAQDCSGTTSVTAGKMNVRAGDATGGSGTRNGGAMLLRAGRGATSDGNIAFHADPASWNGMGRGLFVGNRSAAPTGNPADGGYLYAESGDIYWRSSGGVTTQLN